MFTNKRLIETFIRGLSFVRRLNSARTISASRKQMTFLFFIFFLFSNKSIYKTIVLEIIVSDLWTLSPLLLENTKVLKWFLSKKKNYLEFSKKKLYCRSTTCVFIILQCRIYILPVLYRLYYTMYNIHTMYYIVYSIV